MVDSVSASLGAGAQVNFQTSRNNNNSGTNADSNSGSEALSLNENNQFSDLRSQLSELNSDNSADINLDAGGEARGLDSIVDTVQGQAPATPQAATDTGAATSGQTGTILDISV